MHACGPLTSSHAPLLLYMSVYLRTRVRAHLRMCACVCVCAGESLCACLLSCLARVLARMLGCVLACSRSCLLVWAWPCVGAHAARWMRARLEGPPDADRRPTHGRIMKIYSQAHVQPAPAQHPPHTQVAVLVSGTESAHFRSARQRREAVYEVSETRRLCQYRDPAQLCWHLSCTRCISGYPYFLEEKDRVQPRRPWDLDLQAENLEPLNLAGADPALRPRGELT